MSDTAVVDTTNPSQSGPSPVPNQDRKVAPAADETKTPEQIAAEAAAKTPEQIAAEAAAAEPPKVGDEPGEDGKLDAPTSADADEDGVITYPATGDPGMDMALEFVGKLGIGMDDPAMQATLTGDFSLIRAKLAAMGDKAAGHERMCDLAEQANTRAGEKATAAAKAITTAVASVLGESQKEVLAFASKNATPAEKASINAMLRADPVQARAAASMLLSAYQRAGGTVIQPASATTDATGSVPAQSNTRLTNKQFAAETQKIANQYGSHNVHRTTEYAALVRRLG